MSVTRRVSLKIDIEEIEQVAKDLGYTTVRGGTVGQYHRDPVPVDLAVKKHLNDRYGIGFIQNAKEDTTEIVYDETFASEIFSSLIPTYQERVIQRKTARSHFRVTDRVEDATTITLRIQR